MKELRVTMKGGLGNQLFQYFAGSRLAASSCRKLVLDLSWYSRNIHSNGLLDARKFELNDYLWGRKIEKVDDFSFKNSIYLERVSRKIPRSLLLKVGLVEELADGEISKRKILQTYGHWLGGKGLPKRTEVRDKLTNQFEHKRPIFLELKEEIEKCEITAMHVRMGDYLNFPQVYSVVNQEYYSEALKKIEDIGSEVWLFSDNPMDAERMISGLHAKFYNVSREFELTPAETIALIASAKNIVASNSTFSWWAAYASENASVFFPMQYTKQLSSDEAGLKVMNWTYL
jgi:hypothetical protein